MEFRKTIKSYYFLLILMFQMINLNYFKQMRFSWITRNGLQLIKFDLMIKF